MHLPVIYYWLDVFCLCQLVVESCCHHNWFLFLFQAVGSDYLGGSFSFSQFTELCYTSSFSFSGINHIVLRA